MGIFTGKNVEDFIFGEGTTYPETEAYDEQICEEVENAPVMECYEGIEAAGYRIALENEQNYNAIMGAIMMDEMACLESGVEVVYEAGKIKSFFATVKKFFLIAWQKIQGIFKRANEWITKYTKDNGLFLKRYKHKNIKDVAGAKLEKGYDFAGIYKDYAARLSAKINEKAPVTIVMNYSKEEAKEFVKKFNGSGKEEVYEQLEEIFKKDGDKRKWNQSFKEVLRGKEIKNMPCDKWDTLMKEMSEAGESRQIIKDMYAKAKKFVDTEIKHLQKLEKAVGDEKKKDIEHRIPVAKCMIDVMKHAMNILSQAQGIHLAAVTEWSRQERAMAMEILKNQPKDSTNESAVGGGEGFLAGVSLI